MGEKGVSQIYLPESLVAILSERKARQRSRLFARWNVAQAPTGFAEIGSDDFHSSPNLIFPRKS